MPNPESLYAQAQLNANKTRKSWSVYKNEIGKWVLVQGQAPFHARPSTTFVPAPKPRLPKKAPAEKKTACRECDKPTNFTRCSVCGWAICGFHAKRRATVRGTAAKTFYVCPQCANEGF